MEINTILDVLKKNFDLKKNHVLIIKTLYPDNELTADQILAKTKIPKGGIYEFLNYLLKYDLIEKSLDVPAKYSVKNFNKKLLNFLHKEFENFSRKEAELLELLKEKEEFGFNLITNTEQYTFELINAANGGSKFDAVIRHGSIPYELYPEDEKDFIKLREIIWAKRKVLSGTENPNLAIILYKAIKDIWNKKKPIRYLITKSGFDYNLNLIKDKLSEDEFKEIVRSILKKLKKYDIKMKVTSEHSPFNLFISDKKVMFVIAHETKIITGFTSTNKEIISVYQNLFESMYNNSENKNVEFYLQKYLD